MARICQSAPVFMARHEARAEHAPDMRRRGCSDTGYLYLKGWQTICISRISIQTCGYINTLLHSPCCADEKVLPNPSPAFDPSYHPPKRDGTKLELETNETSDVGAQPYREW